MSHLHDQNGRKLAKEANFVNKIWSYVEASNFDRISYIYDFWKGLEKVIGGQYF